MKARTLARPLVMVAAALALFAVLLVSRAALAQPAQTITLKLADSLPTTHYVVVQAAKPWMDRVVQLSKTKVEFQYYPSEQLGKHERHAEYPSDRGRRHRLHAARLASRRISAPHLLHPPRPLCTHPPRERGTISNAEGRATARGVHEEGHPAAVRLGDSPPMRSSPPRRPSSSRRTSRA